MTRYPADRKLAKPARQKVGEALYIFPVVVLISALVLSFASDWDPGESTIAGIISAALFINTSSSLLTEDIGVRGAGAVKKAENRRLYWTQFVIQAVIVIAFLLIAIFVQG